MPERYITLDFESSGLAEHSYPIEVGVAIGDGQRIAQRFNTLIRPRAGWIEHGVWLAAAQAIHGITEAELSQGLDADEVCDRLDAMLKGQVVIVDGGEWDIYWLLRLYAGRKPAFRLCDIEKVPYNALAQMREKISVAHRAQADADWLHDALMAIEWKIAA